MQRRHGIATLVLVLLGATGALIWLLPSPLLSPEMFRKHITVTEPGRGSDSHATATETAAGAASTTASRTPTVVPSTPEEYAKAWQERALKSIRHKNARLLGEDAAALLALSPEKAWAELTRRGRDGDKSAAAAALALADECYALNIWRASGEDPNQTKDYPKDWPGDHAERLHAIEALQTKRMIERAAGCTSIKDMSEFVRYATDRFMRDDDPAVQLDAARDIKDEDEAIAALRRLTGGDPKSDATWALALRLARSSDPARQQEGRAMLEPRAAQGDYEAIVALAACLRGGCTGMHASLETILAWESRAAGLGEWAVISLLILDYSTLPPSDQTQISAWAWSQYRLMLAQDGCFEAVAASSTHLDAALREALRLERTLTPSQRQQGEALLRQLIAQWSAQAHAAQGCG